MIHKNKLYYNEQIQIMNEIITILELDEKNSILLYNLDNDDIKKQKILDCIPGARNPDKTKRAYLSIIRQITKLEYIMKSYDHRIYNENETIRTIKYIFSKKDT